MRVEHAESAGSSRPSIVARLSLCLSLCALVVSGAALWVAIDPEPVRELVRRAAAWIPEPDRPGDFPPPPADPGARKRAVFDHLRARGPGAPPR